MNVYSAHLSESESESQMAEIAALHRAAQKGDWVSAQELLRNESMITTPITEAGEIALHIAALEGHEYFVSELLKIMKDANDVATLNAKGCTALTFAAAAGHTHIARLMVEKHPTLASIKGENGVRPLYMAALLGFEELAEFLLPSSGFESWTLQEKANVLTASVESELYGLAVQIVGKDQKLAVAEDGDGMTTLEVLARKPLAFSCSTATQGLWMSRIRTG